MECQDGLMYRLNQLVPASATETVIIAYFSCECQRLRCDERWCGMEDGVTASMQRVVLGMESMSLLFVDFVSVARAHL